jgi:demethylmenaquinone methyltransferase / 2-methoxy-6-polyprenyl-1,4-benzoquinol methylase
LQNHFFNTKLLILAKHVTPYQKEGASKKEQVEEMFDNIAHRYDFLNHLLSAGIDKTWRRKAIKHIAAYKPRLVMDMATGTGDFAIDTAERLDIDKVVGLDLSEEMLAIGRKKSSGKSLQNKIEYVKGDSENLQYPDNTFDAMTAGFGVRNFENLEKGLTEMHRVLKPGAPLVILEVSQPDAFPMKQVFGVYFKLILPTIGRVFSKDHRAYTYLPESVEAFPKGDNFVNILKKIGFKNAKHHPLTFGICAMYTCEK